MYLLAYMYNFMFWLPFETVFESIPHERNPMPVHYGQVDRGILDLGYRYCFLK